MASASRPVARLLAVMLLTYQSCSSAISLPPHGVQFAGPVGLGMPGTVPPEVLGNCTKHSYSQVLDHFGAKQQRFSQRYFVCHAGGQQWRQGAPIFLYTGNEADVELYLNATGLMWEWAPEFGALLVFIEHRYFGESVPPADLSPPLAFLTTDQALGDYAEFAVALRRDILNSTNSPVVGFGGSYGGMLCAWLRITAPWAIDACLAASAPIMSFMGLDPPVNPNFFAEIVTQDASSAGGSEDTCKDRIHSAWHTMQTVSAEALRRNLRLCSIPTNTWDVIFWISSAFDYMAMGSYPYASSYILNGKGFLPPYPLRKACAKISAAPADPLNQLRAVRDAVGIFYNYSGDVQCFNTSASSNNASKRDAELWNHIYCSEILQVFGRNGVTDMYWNSPWDVTAAQQNCLTTTGIWPDANWVATRYGGWQIAGSATRILFSNGGLDPWRGGGVQTTLGPELPAVIIPEVGHHIDLFWSRPDDPQAVREARTNEKAWIRKWVEQVMAQTILI